MCEKNDNITENDTPELPYKCYNLHDGCKGLISINPEEFMLFSSESDYNEWYTENVLLKDVLT